MRNASELRIGARLALSAFSALGILLAASSPASAAGGTYHAVQCHDFNRAHHWGQLTQSGGYDARQQCDQAEFRYLLQSTGYGNLGGGARVTFSAPAGTEIAGFSLAFDGRTSDGHYAQVQVVQGGGALVVHRAPNQPGGYIGLSYGNLGASAIVVELTCQNNPPCAPSSAAHAWVRNVDITFRDNHDPTIGDVAGGLLDGGWRRGQQSLSATAGDFGAGVVDFGATVNGTTIGTAVVACNGESPPYAANFVPCQGNPSFTINPDTAAGPFVNGHNTIELVATDYAGNRRVAAYGVQIDNAPPSLVFENAQDPNDPELLRAPVADQHSGLSGAAIFLRPAGTEPWEALETQIKDGEARARVDSLARPAGEYEFRAEAYDVAGNTVATTRRRDGTPMKLTFPLRNPVELRGHLNRGASKGQAVRYGTRSKAKGLLLDAGGQPIAGQNVTVIEHFGEGALIRDRVTQAETDETGKWRTKVPAGPSREVEVHFDGSGRYAPASRGVGALAVRSGVSFKTSGRNVPEGETMTFKGQVRHRGARIPSGGKLVELQVRVRSGRWDTVGEAFRTNERGRYRRGYRFGKQYANDTLFRFRVKVRREANWPYKKTTTRQRKVIVRAR